MAVNKKIKHVGMALGIVILGAVILVVLRLTAPLVIAEPAKEKIWPVATQIIKVSSIRPVIREFGTIVAGSQADLRPLVAGRIIEVAPNYFEGSIVRKGQLLVKIDSFDYEVKVEDNKAALNEVLTRIAETEGEIKYETKLLKITGSQLSLRKRNLERRRKLVKKGSASRKSLDDAELTYNDTAKNFAVRQQVILRLRNRLNQQKASSIRAQSALKLAKRNLDETTINTPFDGFLANADVSTGQRVGTNDRLARLIEAKRLEVKFRLSERDFSALIKNNRKIAADNIGSSELIGKGIKVKWNIGNQAIAYKASIQRVGAEIDAAGGGVDVYARLKDIKLTTALRPGAFVDLIIPSRLYENVAQVPDTAVVRRNFIYVIEKGRVKEIRVELVRTGAHSVLIRGSGLHDKMVITRPFPKIASGLRVESK